MNYLFFVFSQSFIYKVIVYLAAIFKHSYIYKIPNQAVNYISFVYSDSYVNQFFRSNHSFFTPLFANGIFYKLIALLFKVTGLFLILVTSLWNGSCTENIWNHLREDCSNNYIRYLSAFLFLSLITFTLLTLLWGSGYTRDQFLPFVVIIFIFFSLSQLKGKTNEYLANSVIVQWIKKIYL